MRDRPRSGQGALLRDRFELLVPLGSGGFGTVWEGFDMLLERAVAIKELPVDGDVSDAGDALREARATARLNHPAIVSLYEIIAEPDRIYMISELVHGCTLDEMIGDGYLSDQDCGRIGVALCEALSHAHAQGVMHRDVKPANVMVTSEWIDGVSGWRAQPAKLMDFGISSIVDREGGNGPHAGSHGYVAPEQEAGEPASPAGDVYSLALVLFECFTGTLPAGRRNRLARARRELPAELARCIDSCLDPEPELRPTLPELSAALDAALPLLSDELQSRGPLAWLRRLVRPRRPATSARATSGSLRARSPQPRARARGRNAVELAPGLRGRRRRRRRTVAGCRRNTAERTADRAARAADRPAAARRLGAGDVHAERSCWSPRASTEPRCSCCWRPASQGVAAAVVTLTPSPGGRLKNWSGPTPSPGRCGV